MQTMRRAVSAPRLIALATAVGIAVVIALLAAPVADVVERKVDAISPPSSPDASVAEKSAIDGVQPSASAAVDPSPLQQRTDDDASLRATPVETLVAESSLSAQEAHDFFVEGDACLVLASDAKSKERCTRAAALAELIVKVPKTSTDSWAYGMEYELNRRLTELLNARDLRVLKRRAVQCNALGCLVYVEGPSTWPGKFRHLTAQIRSDPDIGELNRQGRWPGARPWSHGVDHGSMLVLPRY